MADFRWLSDWLVAGESAHIAGGTGHPLMTPQPRLGVKQVGAVVRRERKKVFASGEGVRVGDVVCGASPARTA
jgi:hypothetical protein